MRVAVITTSYPAFPGDPSGHFVHAEVQRLAEADEVVVITASGNGAPNGFSREPSGVHVWREPGGTAFGWPGIAARVGERPWRLGSALSWCGRARTRLRALGPFDRVIAHWAVPSAFPIARDGGPRLEVVSHGGDVRLLTRLPPFVRQILTRRLLGRVTRWRFVSHALYDELAASSSAEDRARLLAIAYVEAPLLELPDVAARASRLRQQARGGALGEERPVLVCVGRLVASKRFDRALEHAAFVAQNRPRARPHVVVVGDGPERRRLETHARALGLDARFVGRTTRHDALAWIGAADTLLHASKKEGLSTVVREAKALGVAVEVVP